MRHNQVIHLISITFTTDDIGNQVETPSERQVFANEFAISSSEFYSAAVAGLKPIKQFEIYSFEYQGEMKIRHDGTVYRIIRTQTKGERTRLTCERTVG